MTHDAVLAAALRASEAYVIICAMLAGVWFYLNARSAHP